MRYLSTVYLGGHEAKVSRSKGSLIVSSPTGKERIPLQGIDAIVILGGAQATVDALAACAEAGVRVAALRRSGKIRFTVNAARAGNVHLRLAQAAVAMDDRASTGIAKMFVAGKLQNSRRVISRWSRDAEPGLTRRLLPRMELITDRLGRLASAPTGDHLRGIEGDAARAHFAAMRAVLADGPLPFVERNRRPPRDPANAMLGFCYGLLITEFAGAVEAVGLDHQIGFLHGARSGRPSLALDLAEELRPLVDRFVVTLIRRGQVSPGAFTVTPGGATYLTEAGRSTVIRAWEHEKNHGAFHSVLGHDVDRWALPSVQATLLARHLRGDLPVYPPYVVAN